MDKDEKTKKSDRNPLYLLRCPNAACGKIHFSVLNLLLQALRLPAHCLGCQKAKRISHYLVYERDAKLLLRSYCELCAKESVKVLNSIHRVCERSGWERLDGGVYQVRCPHDGCKRVLFAVAKQVLGNPILPIRCEKCEAPLKMLMMKEAESVSAPIQHYFFCSDCQEQFKLDVFPIKVWCRGCRQNIIMYPNWGHPQKGSEC